MDSYRVFDREVQHRTTLAVAVVAVAAAVPTLDVSVLGRNAYAVGQRVFTAPMLP